MKLKEEKKGKKQKKKKEKKKGGNRWQRNVYCSFFIEMWQYSLTICPNHHRLLLVRTVCNWLKQPLNARYVVRCFIRSARKVLVAQMYSDLCL